MRRIWLVSVASVVIAIVLFAYWTRIKTKKTRLDLLDAKSGSTSMIVSTTPYRSSPVSQTATPPPMEPGKEAAAIVTEVFNAPIAFFGKVQDQTGAPISEARVEFGAIDKFWEAGSSFQVVSDASGLFSITGIKGAGLTVGVSKNGYAGIKGLSYQSFGYGMPPDSNRKAPPRKEKPALFILRKKAEAEPLVVVHRDIRIPKDGTSVDIDLRTGKQVATGLGQLKIECWTSDQLKDSNGRYEWHARISVPGGGIIRRVNTELDFVAPDTGYESTIDFTMPQTSLAWRRDHDANYWIKLHDLTYARMRLRLTTAGDHFVTIAGYVNPSGSRNLEYDEDKFIK